MFRLGWGKILPDSGESKCWAWQGYDAQTPVRDGTCRPVGSFFVSAGDPKGCRGRAESPLQAAACKKIPAGGLTRRLRRGRWGCRPVGAVLSFEAKESTKESQRHGDYEDGPRRCAPWASACGSPFGAVLGLGSLRSPAGKRLLLPILAAGLAMSRAMDLDRFHLRLERARARLFPPSKWAGLFPSAAYRRSAPPQVAWSILKWRCLGCVYVAWMASQRRKTDLTFLL